MKKTYIIPRIETLEIGMENCLLLTASGELTTEESFTRDIVYIDFLDEI